MEVINHLVGDNLLRHGPVMGRRKNLEDQEKQMQPRERSDKGNLCPRQKCKVRTHLRKDPLKIKRREGEDNNNP